MSGWGGGSGGRLSRSHEEHFGVGVDHHVPLLPEGSLKGLDEPELVSLPQLSGEACITFNLLMVTSEW